MITIHDVVHGDMQFPTQLKPIIDTPIFQRLGRIQQLGPCQFIYPTATHTRKSHSFGAAHLAGVWMRHFDKFSEREILLAQTAALIHDLGHVCFSHLFDKIAKSVCANQSHEIRSIIAFNKIVQDQKLDFTEQEINTISDLVHGKCTTLPNIVSNDTIDVDRMDYLMRDSYFTGVPIAFQPDRLINGSYLENNIEIKFKPKLQPNINQFLHTREYFYSEIYRHKTVEKINKLLLEALRHIIPLLKLYFKDTQTWMTDLDDYTTYALLKTNTKSKEIIEQIESRKLTSYCF
jgi:HD superfamily phosphohydrolase